MDRRSIMNAETQRSKAGRLRELHLGDDVLVLPNALDTLSARVFEACGFPTIATTSAGIAYALGVPVTADVETGYGPSPEEAAETARAMIGAGAVGLNLEDAATASPPG